MRRLVVAAILSAVALSLALTADPTGPDSQKFRPVADVLADIRQSQGVSADAGIDPRKVSDYQLEELGVSVMEERLGSPGLRARMDSLMGGVGSFSAALVHSQIGYNYLRGGRGGTLPDMMGYGRWDFGHTMAGERYWLWGLVVVLVFMLGGALIVLAIVLLRRSRQAA